MTGFDILWIHRTFKTLKKGLWSSKSNISPLPLFKNKLWNVYLNDIDEQVDLQNDCQQKSLFLGPVRWLSGQALVTTPDNLSSISFHPETTMALRENGPDLPSPSHMHSLPHKTNTAEKRKPLRHWSKLNCQNILILNIDILKLRNLSGHLKTF